VDARDNRRLWGGQYNLEIADIQAIQAEIAREISQKLQPRLSGEDNRRLTKRYTESGEAYQLYIQSMYYRHQGKKEGWEKSIEYSEEVIKIDPNFAPVYVELATCYSDLGLGGFLPSKEARQKAGWAAQKAVEIDDTLGPAHASLGYVKQGDWDWSGAEKEFNRALQLDPNSRELHQIYGAYLLDVGRADEAIVFQKRVQELDPLGQNPSALLGFAYLGARKYDQAIEEFLKAVERNPNRAGPHSFLGEVYVYQGRYDEGIAELQKAIAIQNAPESWNGDPKLAFAYAVSRKRDEALKILDRQKELAKQQRYISPFNFAVIYTGLGDKDQAFEWLEKCYAEHSQPLEHLKMRPMFDSLRSDPRYTDLIRRMNLEP
jgi:tetratricopeptide (TPR) repeat protein